MEVPKKIVVDVKENNNAPTTNHVPAGYYTDSEYEYDSDLDNSPPRPRMEPTTRLMSPPEKLTIPEISDEERRRFLRDASLNGGSVPFSADDSMYKTPNDSVLKNMTSFQSGDPVSLARQVRHLHNRVKLLEEELQTQHNRQIFMFGVLSVYILSRGIKWMIH